MDNGEAKSALRKRMTHRREATHGSIDRITSCACQENMLKNNLWISARKIALYVPIRGEADTALLLENAWKTGKEVFLPTIADVANHIMTFAPCSSFAELKPGIWNIPQPLPGPEPESLDLMILPGLAFDLRGHRLGYGGGYYDRYLSSHPGVCKHLTGLCLSFQLVDAVPADKWDLCVNSICSEECLLWI